ncbi:MAG: hypothetical protein JW889_08380 [Verrucomicrobia bacterium]|nr:hypothetical protein [Verrucomicrobiota bacterium]
MPKSNGSRQRRRVRVGTTRRPRLWPCSGASSSITPGVPPENLDALVEGQKDYLEHGRG